MTDLQSWSGLPKDIELVSSRAGLAGDIPYLSRGKLSHRHMEQEENNKKGENRDGPGQLRKSRVHKADVRSEVEKALQATVLATEQGRLPPCWSGLYGWLCGLRALSLSEFGIGHGLKQSSKSNNEQFGKLRQAELVKNKNCNSISTESPRPTY